MSGGEGQAVAVLRQGTLAQVDRHAQPGMRGRFSSQDRLRPRFAEYDYSAHDGREAERRLQSEMLAVDAGVAASIPT